MNAHDAALAYSAAGLSCIPIRTDGTKAPAISSWKDFQSRIMTGEEIDRNFSGNVSGNVGIAVLGGEVSGNLECLDIDAPELVAPFWQIVEDELPGLLDRITTIATPRNNHSGRHLWYRGENQVEGNRKLAMSEPRPQFNADGTPQMDPRTGAQRLAPQTMIETRGAGG